MPRRPASTCSAAVCGPRSRRHRYWAIAALGAVALASPLAVAAAPAAAQGTIQFSSASGDGSGNLTITVASDYQLTDWTLSLSDGSSTYTMDDFTDFVDQDKFAAGQPQTYVLPVADAPAVFGSGSGGINLPPGNYNVTATNAIAGTDTFSGPQTMTGTFSFLAQPLLALGSATFYTTQPDQSVAITGQVTGCSTVACPASWSGTAVTVTDVKASGHPQWTGATTDSAGDFSVPDVTGVPGDSYSASMPAVPGVSLAATAPAATQDVPQYAQTSITATATPAAYGTQSIKGQLTYQSSLQQIGAGAGIPVTATAGPHKVSTTTGSNGDFSLTLPPVTGTTTWLLSTSDSLTTTPFLAGTQDSVDATQLWPAKITGFTATVNRYRQVTVAGCMSTTISPPPTVEYPQVDIQWRGRRSGPWRELGTVATMHQDGCAGVGFIGYGSAPAPSAYYRAYFPGDSVYTSAASSSTGRLWYYNTRFYRFRASSRSVLAGRKVTISGTLQYDNGRWRGYGHQRIAIIFSRSGKGNTWYLLRWVKTSRTGTFAVTFRDYAPVYWSANFGGNSTHWVVSAPEIRVRVRGRKHAMPVSAGQPARPLMLAPRTTSGTMWPFVLSADPLLAMMGESG